MKPPKVIPVIHVRDCEQALRNARIAATAGCHGVILIQMEGRNDLLIEPMTQIIEECPDLKVGLNLLGTAAPFAIRASYFCHMAWTDEQPTHSQTRDTDHMAAIRSALAKNNPGFDFFCGVAFKHQAFEPDPIGAANEAVRRGWIPTTSGPATGKTASVVKIERLREGMGPEAPLAIASGITPENVHVFAPHLTHILVATGISSSFHEIDPRLMDALMGKLR